MKITIVPTSEITEMDGRPVRLWKGQTESGIRVALAVHKVIVPDTDRQTEFERDLRAVAPPAEDRQRPFHAALGNVFDLRMIY